jgi:hypothetical protein
MPASSRSSRSPVQHALPTAGTTDRPTVSLTRSAFLRLSMIPGTQQRPLLRRRNTQPNAFCSIAHIGIAAHSSAYGALANDVARGPVRFRFSSIIVLWIIFLITLNEPPVTASTPSRLVLIA